MASVLLRGALVRLGVLEQFVIGTAETRRANHEERCARRAYYNATIANFGKVQPGTLSMLKALRAEAGMGMDKLLYSLVSHARRTGWPRNP